MTDDNSQTDQTKIDWLKTAAGALAAVTTAVLLSTLGAAGTLIGAALGSVAVTVSSQLYTQGLARSKRTVAKAQESALQKVGIAQAEVRRAGRRQDKTGAVEAHLEAADDRLDQARAELEVEVAPTARERLLLLPWKKIGLTTAGLFLAALALIASFEAVAGRSVSSFTGGSDKDSGSTFTGGGSSDDGDKKDDPKQEPTEQESDPTDAPSEEPSDEPSDVPTEEPSETPSETPTETPSETTEPTPTEGLPTLPTAPTPTP